jgi:hypothetical protein
VQGASGDVPDDSVFIFTQKQKRAVFWRAPTPIPGIEALHGIVAACLNNAGGVARMTPNTDQQERICKVCNDIMTQFGTSSNLLVRETLNPTPLIPLRKIRRFDVKDNVAGVAKIIRGKPMVLDPNRENRSNKYLVVAFSSDYRFIVAHTHPLNCNLEIPKYGS